jgi:hypothetical protein
MSECLDHHPVCKAECCKEFTLTIKDFDKVREGAQVAVVPGILTKDLKWYFELHGATFRDGFIMITKAGYKKIKGTQDRYVFHRRCAYLNADLTCKGHPTDKPLCCQELTRKTCHEDRFTLTPNCVFRRKTK